jgi:outer membrane protein OmpA-like peptidoglycan-associated protein
MLQLVLCSCLLLFASCLMGQQNTIFEENFDNNFLLWMHGESADYKAQVEDGHYQVTYKHERGAWYFWQSVPVHPDTSYYIESKITPFLESKQSVYGLIWGVRDLNNYNAFLMSNEGKTSVMVCRNGVVTKIVNWTQVGYYQSNQTHTLAIRKNNGKMRYYLDGQLIMRTPILPFYGDLLGFIITGKTSAHIDHLLVRQDRAINLVKNALEGYERKNAGSAINSPYAELHPLIAHDGQSLFVTRKGHPDNIGDDKRDDAWVAYKQADGSWSPLHPLPAPLNNNNHNQVISVSPDNNTLLLGNTYLANGQSKGKGVSISHRQADGSWEVPKDVIIDNFYTHNPIHSIHLAASEQLLLLSLERNDTRGHLDLYVSFLQPNGHFSQPKNLGSTINTPYIDGTPFLAADGKTLYFSSAGHGGYGSTDIFVSRRLDDTWENWTEPENLGPQINSNRWEAYYSTSAFGDRAYFVSTQGPDHIGAEDVYEIVPPESARPAPILLVKGKVYDAMTKRPLRAHIRYYEQGTQKEQGSALSSSVQGNYQVVLPPEQDYEFLGYCEGYYPVTERLSIGKITESTERRVNLYLHPIEVGETIPLRQLVFDAASGALDPYSTRALKRLVTFMKRYPNMRVVLHAPTVEQRQQLQAYLLKAGVADHRLQLSKKGTAQHSFQILSLAPTDEPVQYSGNFNAQLTGKDVQEGQIFRLDRTYFAADSFQFAQATVPELQQVASFLQKNPAIVVEVGGHTNGLPQDVYCDTLSTRRARQVAQFLVDLGAAPTQVHFQGYGKRHPVASNKTLHGRQRNQRVELKILSSSSTNAVEDNDRPQGAQ